MSSDTILCPECPRCNTRGRGDSGEPSGPNPRLYGICPALQGKGCGPTWRRPTTDLLKHWHVIMTDEATPRILDCPEAPTAWGPPVFLSSVHNDVTTLHDNLQLRLHMQSWQRQKASLVEPQEPRSEPFHPSAFRLDTQYQSWDHKCPPKGPCVKGSAPGPRPMAFRSYWNL